MLFIVTLIEKHWLNHVHHHQLFCTRTSSTEFPLKLLCSQTHCDSRFYSPFPPDSPTPFYSYCHCHHPLLHCTALHCTALFQLLIILHSLSILGSDSSSLETRHTKHSTRHARCISTQLNSTQFKALHYTLLDYITLPCILMWCTALHCTTSWCTKSHRSIYSQQYSQPPQHSTA